MRLFSSDFASAFSSSTVPAVIRRVVSCVRVDFGLGYCLNYVVDVEEEEGGGEGAALRDAMGYRLRC